MYLLKLIVKVICQICNRCKCHYLIAKFNTNASASEVLVPPGGQTDSIFKLSLSLQHFLAFLGGAGWVFLEDSIAVSEAETRALVPRSKYVQLGQLITVQSSKEDSNLKVKCWGGSDGWISRNSITTRSPDVGFGSLIQRRH